VTPGNRRDELAANLARVERRIAAACAASGRDRSEVTLVVVTKFFPAADVHHLHHLGVRHVAENRHQEAVGKREECAGLQLTWHYVGHLQSNKAAAVGGWADVVQSVDRAKLLPGLARAAEDRGVLRDVLLQVSLDPPEAAGARSGAPPDRAVELAAACAGHAALRLRGVMGVAPLRGDPQQAFALLLRTAAQVRTEVPTADWVSAGMSGDLEQGVEAGATHVRVGSAVLGNRPAQR
jgi:PLP dependent protein